MQEKLFELDFCGIIAPGHRYAQEFSKLAPRYVRVLRSVPVIGKDWNEQLMGLLKKRGLSKGMSR